MGIIIHSRGRAVRSLGRLKRKKDKIKGSKKPTKARLRNTINHEGSSEGNVRAMFRDFGRFRGGKK